MYKPTVGCLVICTKPPTLVCITKKDGCQTVQFYIQLIFKPHFGRGFGSYEWNFFLRFLRHFRGCFFQLCFQGKKNCLGQTVELCRLYANANLICTFLNYRYKCYHDWTSHRLSWDWQCLIFLQFYLAFYLTEPRWAIQPKGTQWFSRIGLFVVQAIILGPCRRPIEFWPHDTPAGVYQKSQIVKILAQNQSVFLKKSKFWSQT